MKNTISRADFNALTPQAQMSHVTTGGTIFDGPKVAAPKPTGSITAAEFKSKGMIMVRAEFSAMEPAAGTFLPDQNYERGN